MVNFQIVNSVDIFFSKYGKEKLGGLSNDGEDLSWAQQLLTELSVNCHTKSAKIFSLSLIYFYVTSLGKELIA